MQMIGFLKGFKISEAERITLKSHVSTAFSSYRENRSIDRLHRELFLILSKHEVGLEDIFLQGDAENPLHRAVEDNHEPLLRYLINRGDSNVNACNKQGLTALECAIHAQKGNLVHILVACPRIKLRRFNPDHGMIANTRRELLAALDSYVKNGNILKLDSEWTRILVPHMIYRTPLLKQIFYDLDSSHPLHVAIESRDLVLFNYLIKRTDIDVNILNKDSSVPLRIAMLLGEVEMVEALISHKDINFYVFETRRVQESEKGRAGVSPDDFEVEPPGFMEKKSLKSLAEKLITDQSLNERFHRIGNRVLEAIAKRERWFNLYGILS